MIGDSPVRLALLISGGIVLLLVVRHLSPKPSDAYRAELGKNAMKRAGTLFLRAKQLEIDGTNHEKSLELLEQRLKIIEDSKEGGAATLDLHNAIAFLLRESGRYAAA